MYLYCIWNKNFLKDEKLCLYTILEMHIRKMKIKMHNVLIKEEQNKYVNKRINTQTNVVNYCERQVC